MSHIGWEENKPPLVCKHFSSRLVLKPWGNPRGKAQIGQYLLAVDLGYQMMCQDAGPQIRVDCDVSHWLGRRTNHNL